MATWWSENLECCWEDDREEKVLVLAAKPFEMLCLILKVEDDGGVEEITVVAIEGWVSHGFENSLRGPVIGL